MVLFSGILHGNLVMAHSYANFDDVINACKAAAIHEVNDKLPDGYSSDAVHQALGTTWAPDRHGLLSR